MIVKTLESLKGTNPGEGKRLWYKNHIEANYVIEGEGAQRPHPDAAHLRVHAGARRR
jgi:hypothetical protein